MPRSNINLAILPVRPALDLKLSALHVQQVSVEGEVMGSEPAHHHHVCTLMEICVQAYSTDLVSLYPPIVGALGDAHNKPATKNGPSGTKKCFLLQKHGEAWVDLATEFSGIWGTLQFLVLLSKTRISMRMNTLWFPSSLSLHLVLGGEGKRQQNSPFPGSYRFIETLGIDNFLRIGCLCSVMLPWKLSLRAGEMTQCSE